MNELRTPTSSPDCGVPVSPYQAWQMQRVQKCSRLVVWFVVALLVVVTARVVQLKVAPEDRLLEAAGSPMSSQTELARRGEILDRHGRVMATSTVGYRLFVDPKAVGDSTTIAVDLARIIGGDPLDIDRKIVAKADKRYVPLVDQLENWQVDAIREAKLKGIGLEPRLVRHYPFGHVGAAVVGLVGFEHTGLGAAELQFDTMLEPTPGKLAYLRDASRHALWIEQDDYTPGAHGESLTLTIDMEIQDLAEQRLDKAVKEFNAGGGRIVVFDCVTGDILAMHDILHPHLNLPDAITDPARKIHQSLGRNRCVTDPYEPGSTFKPFVWAVATELGRAKPNETIACAKPGEVHRTPYGRAVRDTHYYGPVSWHMVLVKSINSGMSIVAERLTHKELRGAMTLFGFGSKTGSNLPGESAGIMTSEKNWSNYTQTSVSYGHEIAVTPLQMVRAFSVFARDGTLPDVHIVRGEQDEQSDLTHLRPARTLISPETLRATKLAMRDVFTEGTGRLAQSEKYEMFGKSGTAQLPKSKGKGYYEDRYTSSFIAAAPYDNPRIVVLCVLDDPDKSQGHFGGAIAGPVVRDVIESTLEYMGVPGRVDESAQTQVKVAQAE